MSNRLRWSEKSNAAYRYAAYAKYLLSNKFGHKMKKGGYWDINYAKSEGVRTQGTTQYSMYSITHSPVLVEIANKPLAATVSKDEG